MKKLNPENMTWIATSDEQFEVWCQQKRREGSDIYRAEDWAKAAWHARDAEVERLREDAEVARVYDNPGDLELNRMPAARATEMMLAAVGALRKDSERLDFIEKCLVDVVVGQLSATGRKDWGCYFPNAAPPGLRDHMEIRRTPREAIDAAMLAAGEVEK